MTQTRQLDQPRAALIDGTTQPSGGLVLPIVNPYTQQQIASFEVASVELVATALSSARRAAPGWSSLAGHRRADLLHGLADVMTTHQSELAHLETAENGKLLRETAATVAMSARMYRYYAGMADKLEGRSIPLDDSRYFDYTLREPVGVVALILPWNAPLLLMSNKLAPALAAGNCAVLKPSEYATLVIMRFAELALEAGIPPGVVNVVPGDAGTGAALTDSTVVDHLSFTGGVATGRLISQRAGALLTPTTMELGGKSANIVFADADLDRAAAGVVGAIFGAAGQACVAGSRLLIEHSVVDEVLQRVAERARAMVIGDPTDPATDLGPLANEPNVRRVRGCIAAAVAAGGELSSYGDVDSDSNFVAPTVFTGVSNDSELARSEVFGPVLAAMPFRDEAEAFRLANDTPFGLAAGAWTSDVGRAHRAAQQLQAGTVWINTYRTSGVQAPFGGHGWSGHGRERGFEGMDPYLRTKNVIVDIADQRI